MVTENKYGKGNMKFTGTWHIVEMEAWDEDYFNMEVQAYIEVEPNRLGHFQFGLVSGQIDGEVEEEGTEARFEFTWEGSDECDSVSGSGWLKLRDKDMVEGKIKFHLGDSSKFIAKRVK
jgi:hypothetical protein